MPTADILRNHVKARLARGEVVSSMTVRMVRTIEVVRIARTAGFDIVYIDLEHSPLSIDATSQICLACLDAGLMPAVRVPANTPEYIGRVLDSGALGIIAPHVQNAEQARAVVKAVKFPPMGERGNAAPLPHLNYRTFPAAETVQVMNDASMVIVQFESQQALDNAEEIAAIDGVDMVLIGVNDYLADIGLAGQYDHPKVRECYSRTIAACRRHGKHCGVGGLASRPDQIAEYVRMGARYVSSGTDISFLLAGASERARQIKAIKV